MVAYDSKLHIGRWPYTSNYNIFHQHCAASAPTALQRNDILGFLKFSIIFPHTQQLYTIALLTSLQLLLIFISVSEISILSSTL